MSTSGLILHKIFHQLLHVFSVNSGVILIKLFAMEAGYGHCRVIALSTCAQRDNATTRLRDNAIKQKR